ncbi:cobalt ECF transporter T component CbiQ [Corynebacterium sp. sy039]|nr:cobalt ECF transporter T component CbiQ [Corynebacterium sp. sy039]
MDIVNPLEKAAVRNPWAKRSVGEKAFLFFGFVVLSIGLAPLPTLPLCALCLGLLVLRTQVPLSLFCATMSALSFFIALGVLPLIFRLSLHGIELIDAGLQRAALLLCRSVIASAAVVLFSLTTPLAEVIAWLGRIGLPQTLCYVIMLMYRMISIMLTTAQSMWQAQALRLGHSNKRRMVQSAAAQAASLFVISFTKARNLGAGLELRADPTAMQVMLPRRQANVIRIIAISVLFGFIIAASI